MPLSRRTLFSTLFRPLRTVAESQSDAGGSGDSARRGGECARGRGASDLKKVAVIQGRYCLAYRSFCSTCVEHCPVPGAIEVRNGIPQVVADQCNGCAICRDVCPAPINAVLILTRKLA